MRVSDPTDTHIDTHAARIHEKPDAVASFEMSRYGQPQTLGELLRKSRLEKNLYGKDLAERMGVNERFSPFFKEPQKPVKRSVNVRLVSTSRFIGNSRT